MAMKFGLHVSLWCFPETDSTELYLKGACIFQNNCKDGNDMINPINMKYSRKLVNLLFIYLCDRLSNGTPKMSIL